MARLCTHTESGHYLMALDAGTGSVRAVIFDLQGKQIAVGQAEWQHLAVPDVPGSMEFDLAKNWQLACQCIRQALQKAAIPATAIAAVSACSMREGIVIYDSNGEPIWACANVDARAAHEVSELKELHDNTFEEEVYRCSGQTLALSAIPRLLWLAHHRPDIYHRASTVTMISDWMAFMLSGELAVDPSNAGTTGLLDLVTRNWKRSLLQMAGLRSDILSPVKETGTLLGHISQKAAEQCDLRGYAGHRWRRRCAVRLSGAGRRTPGANGRAGRNLLATGRQSSRAGHRPKHERSHQSSCDPRYGTNRVY